MTRIKPLWLMLASTYALDTVVWQVGDPELSHCGGAVGGKCNDYRQKCWRCGVNDGGKCGGGTVANHYCSVGCDTTGTNGASDCPPEIDEDGTCDTGGFHLTSDWVNSMSVDWCDANCVQGGVRDAACKSVSPGHDTIVWSAGDSWGAHCGGTTPGKCNTAGHHCWRCWINDGGKCGRGTVNNHYCSATCDGTGRDLGSSNCEANTDSNGNSLQKCECGGSTPAPPSGPTQPPTTAPPTEAPYVCSAGWNPSNDYAHLGWIVNQGWCKDANCIDNGQLDVRCEPIAQRAHAFDTIVWAPGDASSTTCGGNTPGSCASHGSNHRCWKCWTNNGGPCPTSATETQDRKSVV